MKIIRTFKQNKSFLLGLVLLCSLGFIYGCQCEGSIGNSSNNTDTIKTHSEIK